MLPSRISVFVVGLCQTIILPPLFSAVTSTDIDQSVEMVQDTVEMGKGFQTGASFLPIPIIVSDPAVGYGGGVLAVFFHEKPDPNVKQILPPSVSFGGGFYTKSDSWAALGGHFHSFNNDDLRYVGLLGAGNLNLNYQSPEESGNEADPFLRYNIRTLFTQQEVTKRLTERSTLGLRLQYLGTQSAFEVGDVLLPIPEEDLRSDIAGVGLKYAYDTRDNAMSPSKGLNIEVKPYYFEEVKGGSRSYWKTDIKATYHHRIDPFILGLRLEAGMADDSAPFYHLPYVKQRGVPSMLFQGTHVLSSEVELQYTMAERWRALVFAGWGWSEYRNRAVPTSKSVKAAGFGFRYLLLRDLGLQVGLDYAKSDVDSAIYLTIGSGL